MCAGLLWGGLVAAGAAAGDDRARGIEELKTILAKKESDLAQLTASHARKLKDADALARQVEGQKEKPNRNWFEQRAVEKNLARLRAQLQDIEHGAGEEQKAREDSFTYAAAIVSEMESQLEDDLNRLHEIREPAARDRLLERVQALERDRRAYQRRMNALTPAIAAPPDLPANVPWTKEMVEDQARAYEATIARLQAEHEQLVQEQRLRNRYLETVPGGSAPEDPDRQSRVTVRLAELDRQLRLYRAKLAPLNTGSGTPG